VIGVEGACPGAAQVAEIEKFSEGIHFAVLAAEFVQGHSGTSSVKTVRKSDSYGGKKI